MAMSLKQPVKSAPAAAPAAAPAQKPSWLLTGQKASEALAQEQARAEQRDAERKKLHRFWLKPEEEDVKITFLDGDLIAEGEEKGLLDCLFYREHSILDNGRPKQYVCLADANQGKCPMCEAGSSPYLVAAFTIIDHRTIKGKTATYKDEKKLFIAKMRTVQKLRKAASKRGGLRGWTVDVSRTDDRTARVGDTFEFEERHTLEELAAMFTTSKVMEPTDYGKELPFFSTAELVQMGVLSGSVPVGAADAAGSGPETTEDTPF